MCEVCLNIYVSLTELRLAFALFDQNGDGRITCDELYAVMTSLGYECSDGLVRRIVDRYDLDGLFTLPVIKSTE